MQAYSTSAETSVDFVGLFVFSLKDCDFDLSMLVVVFLCVCGNRWLVGRYPSDPS
jgi:hypothetical protein